MQLPRTRAGASELVEDAARTLSDLVAMLRGLGADPRVPQAAKLEAGAAVAYLLSGRGRVPSFIPVVGRIDALAVAAFALRRLLVSAGEPVLRSHWRGSERALDALLAMTAAVATPAGRLRRTALAGAAASLVRERRGPSRVRRPGFGKVLDGEIVARREERA